ncbi:MAG: hypothetical protein AB9897_02315 [Anaerolineaceae bacterium]
MMKRLVFSCVALVLALSLVLVKAPQNVLAVGDGSWVVASPATFVKANVEAAVKTAPAWLQQLSDGINISAPAKICYPFRGGQFHWVPQVMQLKDGKWIKVDTTKEYLFGEEGGLYACAKPSVAGTFVLFGYYSGPAQAKVTSVAACPDSLVVESWDYDWDPGTYTGSGDISNFWANNVNWQNCPNAVTLQWGIQRNYQTDYVDDKSGSLLISSIDPYPQSIDLRLIGPSTWYIYPQSTISDACEFMPYVELLDAGGNVLDILYDTSFPNYCVS